MLFPARCPDLYLHTLQHPLLDRRLGPAPSIPHFHVEESTVRVRELVLLDDVPHPQYLVWIQRDHVRYAPHEYVGVHPFGPHVCSAAGSFAPIPFAGGSRYNGIGYQESTVC